MTGHSVFGLNTMFLMRDSSPGADAAAAAQALEACRRCPDMRAHRGGRADGHRRRFDLLTTAAAEAGIGRHGFIALRTIHVALLLI